MMHDLVPAVQRAPLPGSRVITPAELERLRSQVIDGQAVEVPAPTGPIWHIIVTVAAQLVGVAAVVAWMVAR